MKKTEKAKLSKKQLKQYKLKRKTIIWSVVVIVVLLLIFAAAFAVGVLLFGEDLGVSWNLPLFVLPCVVLGAGVLAVAASLLIGIRILQTKDL